MEAYNSGCNRHFCMKLKPLYNIHIGRNFFIKNCKDVAPKLLSYKKKRVLSIIYPLCVHNISSSVQNALTFRIKYSLILISNIFN